MGSPSDEEDHYQETNPKSKIGILISRLKRMEKNLEINMELNETLNTFLDQLNESQQYLENGIFNVKFAEAGLFLQSAANLYSKKVDSLWDSTLQYQMQLCTYNKLAEAKAEEAAKITQRLNRNKRKKVAVKEVDLNSSVHGDLTNICDKANEFLKGQCFLVHSVSNQNDLLTNEHSTELSPSSSEENYNLNCVNGFSFAVDCTVKNQRTEEKLSNYNDLYLNCSIPYLEMSTDQNNEFQVTNHQHDLLLQKYLTTRHVPYKDFWEHQHGVEFEIFKQTNQSCIVQRNEVDFIEQYANPCSDNSVVTPSRFPSQAAEYEKNDDSLVKTQELIHKEKQLEVTGAIRKGSERISNADSLFHDEPYLSDTETSDNDENHPQYVPQQSRADSGICCSDIPNLSTVMECTDEHLAEHLENTDYNLNETLPCLAEPSQSECIENVSNINDISVQIIQNSESTSAENSSNTVQNEKQSRSDIQVPSIVVVHRTNLSPMENLKIEKLNLKDHDVDNSDEHTVLNTELDETAERSGNVDDAAGRIREVETEISSTCENNEEAIFNSTAQHNNLECSISVVDRSDVRNVENNLDIASRTSKNSMAENVSDHCINKIRDSEVQTAARVKAVTEWKKFMDERLSQAAESSKFDIHQYGSFIMDSIPSENNLPFKDLANGKSSAEVARLFLASLQLANTQNIELITAVPSQEVIANDSLQLKLLTKDRYHEHLKEFEAPSESAFRDNFARIQALRCAPLHSTPKSKRQRFR
ncbi:hypothetical protein ILUMI_21269 [Ignelater luminosus]|uniref:Condensin-2 complex subunit H2 n=1 Tax=Ignelater luminosus TaxID=2038154 RepID=A0A8K0CI24_IGNLU|nr:hypothetical protein ILUMI_21269 [Ignelater luminosus]